MQFVPRLITAFAIAATSASTLAASTVYTSSSSFLSALTPGAYTETFTGLTNPTGSDPANFSGSGFAYSAVSLPTGLYLEDGLLAANQVDQTIVLSFGPGINAVGGEFFTTNFSSAFQAAAVTIALSDGTTATFTPTSTGDSFRGFVSDVAITSLTLTVPTQQSLYASIDNLTVGAAVAVPVPEPASYALFGLGLAGLAAARRRAR